jgi:hypothetical protein
MTGSSGPFDPFRFGAVPHAVGSGSNNELVYPVQPAEKVLRLRPSRITHRFAITPMSGWGLLPPAARIVLLLEYLSHSAHPDGEGGWFRLSAGRVDDAGIRDRHQRRRALASLEADGIIEVDRHRSRSPLIRFTPFATERLLRSATVKKQI